MEKERELLRQAVIEFVPLGIGQNIKWDKAIEEFMKECLGVLDETTPTQDKETFLKAAEVEAEKRCPMPYAKEVTFMQSVDNKNVVYNRKELVKMAQWAYETLTKKQ